MKLVMPAQLVFLPDSELLVPGRAGQTPVLQNLRHACDELLLGALSSIRPESVAVFTAQYSKFGRALPGPAVARDFLSRCGFHGEIVNVGAPITPNATASEVESVLRAPLWLVLGTGAATHGEQAPLDCDDRGKQLDANISRVLTDGHWPKFDAKTIELAHQIGATIVPTLAAANEVLNQASETIAMKLAEKRQHQEFGVTYFAARWKQATESER